MSGIAFVKPIHYIGVVNVGVLLDIAGIEKKLHSYQFIKHN